MLCALLTLTLLLLPPHPHHQHSHHQHLSSAQIRKSHMFFSTIGGDGSQESRSVAGVFVRVFCKSVLFYTMVENFSHKSSIVSLLSVNPFSFPFSTVLSFYKVHIRKCTCFSPTIGGDGSRQYRSDAGVFVRVFCNYVLFLVMVENFSHKT